MNRSDPVVDSLVRLLESQADPQNAEPMKRYLRNKFDFLGIKSPQRRELMQRHLADHREDTRAKLRPLVRKLWDLPYREYQHVAVDLLERFESTLTADDLGLLQHLVTHKSWWDTVDGLAASVVGPLLRRLPEARDGVIDTWRRSDNLWLRRTTLIFQLKYREETDAGLLFSIVRDNADSSEFFLQKAIGWALREYSKTDAEAVVNFVESETLPSLSKREALKWLRSRPV